jgi:hypothetical protein
MLEDRRGASRVPLPEPLPATLSGTEARIVEVSAVGVRVEHDTRLAIVGSAKLVFSWRGEPIVASVSIVYSQVVGRNASGLLYASGLQFTDTSGDFSVTLDMMLAWAEGKELAPVAATPLPLVSEYAIPHRVTADPPQEPMPTATPASAPAPRTVSSFLREATPGEPRFLQARLTANGWIVNEVHATKQPEDGFTIRVERRSELVDLQRTFEYADPDTRRMIRIALDADLSRAH